MNAGRDGDRGSGAERGLDKVPTMDRHLRSLGDTV
jgi:hypothetical protein